MIVYYNDRYLSKDEVSISPDDRGFVFGDGVYEVIYYYPRQLFEMDSHLTRLTRSLTELRINYGDVSNLKSVAKNLIEKNNLQDNHATVYLQITRGVAKRAHAFPPKATPVTVYGSASPFHRDEQKLHNGIKIILLPDIRWSRCDIKSVCLLPNALGNQQAKEAQVGEAIFVRDGMITEGTHTNAFAVFGNTVYTYPKSNYILAGITRKVVFDICRQDRIEIIEEPVSQERFRFADEVFISGTTAEITPVIQVDNHTIGNGNPGPVTRSLQKAFEKIIGQ
ncbi:D-amino-acid transaminase [bacterium]|nr:D-amino-acid transaminase [bacterium]